MPKRKTATIGATIILTALAVSVGLGVAWWAPWKPTLVVWSCGGNYESLSDYSRWFEQQHNCRVRYTAAPVQYLLELATDPRAPADVIVGRGGPGWQALKQRDRLAKGPLFFAIDPFVIITPRGNPANITDLKDLGRAGVRIAYAPFAMRPRGKCPSHLVAMVDAKFYPGFAERWLNNVTVELKCGRKLHEPILAGQADAAIVPRSTTSWPELQGKVEVIPIGPEYHEPMTACRAVPPQCCGVLSDPSSPELANAYVDGMLSEAGQAIFAARGYLPINSPAAEVYGALREVFVPQDMAGWQLHMAQRLYADGAYTSAMRRCFIIYNVFGPSHYDARALYLAGQCAEKLNQPEVARLQWERLLEEFPRKGKHEWESPVLHVGKPVPGVEKMPEQHWVKLARESLKELGGEASLSDEHRRWLRAFPVGRVPILEADPSKCGKRWFATAEMALAAGDYVGATRDYLKVLTLYYPSSYMPAARFRVALCDYLRGSPGTARRRWQELAKALPDDTWAQAAARALEMSAGETDPRELRSDWYVALPDWELKYDTNQQRGMSYGEMLHRHQMPLYAFKEMMKVSHNVYGEPGKLAAEACYRAGVFCKQMGKQTAAGVQWRICQAYWPESKWAEMAGEALKRLAIPDNQNSVERPAIRTLLSQPAPPLLKPDKSSSQQRFHVAEELFRTGILADDQCLLEYMKALSVTDPSGKQSKPFKPIAEYQAGLCLLKVGRLEAARAHFQRVLELYPASPFAAKAAAMLAEGAM